jgi:hypothetical protein
MIFSRHFKTALVLSMLASSAIAKPVRVQYEEGALHAFLILRSEDGKTVAVGNLDQTVKGQQVTDHLKFQFHDGSIYEDTTVFTQHGFFRVLSDHLLQSGPTFKDPIELWIDSPSGQVKVRETKDGKDKTTIHQLSIPTDLANGIVSTIAKDFPSNQPQTVTMLVATPKPRIVKLAITPQGEDTFSIANTQYKATHYVAKIQIGGIAGAVAPVVGKQPPETHLWLLKSAVPIFLKSIGPLSADNAVWQIELASPQWPDEKKQ